MHRSLLYPFDVSIRPHSPGRQLTSCSDGLRHTRIRIQIAYVAIAVTYVVVMATILGACQPFNHYWQINPNPGGMISFDDY